MTGDVKTRSGIELCQQMLVCPVCKGPMDWSSEAVDCPACRESFAWSGRFPDLIVGGRFDDAEDDERSAYETLTNRHLSERYLIPTLRRLFPRPSRPRLLSLGCGVGVDVDILSAEGFDIYGIDNGNRSKMWEDREHPDQLYLANGKNLPFRDGTFDMVYCGCVFPHVGVEGDSNRVAPNYFEERLRIAGEMKRILKPGGFLMVSSPNRLFPLDLFHGRDGGKLIPRWNPPTSRFLLSYGDYRSLFQQTGCNQFQCLPVQNYWGFQRMKRSLKGRVLSFPVDMVFKTVSWEPMRALRPSPISPWLVVLVQ